MSYIPVRRKNKKGIIYTLQTNISGYNSNATSSAIYSIYILTLSPNLSFAITRKYIKNLLVNNCKCVKGFHG